MTNEEAKAYFKRHMNLYSVKGICREAEEIAMKAIGQTTWIPVSERLPKTEERILILFDDGFVMIGHYIDWEDGTPITWVLDGQEDYNVDTNNIIAWMPLPPSYQGE